MIQGHQNTATLLGRAVPPPVGTTPAASLLDSPPGATMASGFFRRGELVERVRECIAKGMSQAEIGRALNRPRRSINACVRKHGLSARDGRRTDEGPGPVAKDTAEMDRKIVAMVHAGASDKEIAAAVGRSLGTVKRRVGILRRRGIEMPKRSMAGRLIAPEVKAARDRKRAALEARKEGKARKQVVAGAVVPRQKNKNRTEAATGTVTVRGAAAGSASSRPAAAPAIPDTPIRPSFVPRGGTVSTTDFMFFPARRARPAATDAEWTMDRHLAWLAEQPGWDDWNPESDGIMVNLIFGPGCSLREAAEIAAVPEARAKARFNALVRPLRTEKGHLPIDAGKLLIDALARRGL